MEYFPNFPNFSNFYNLEMDKHLEVGACPFPNCGKLESWKVRKTRPCCCNPGTQSSPDLQQRKTRIGQLNLCRMKLPYCQRQQKRASRVRRDHKLALRTAFADARYIVFTTVKTLYLRFRRQIKGFLPSSAAVSIYLFKPPYAIGSVPSLSGHAIDCVPMAFTAESQPAQGQ